VEGSQCEVQAGAATLASNAAGDNLIARIWMHVNVLIKRVGCRSSAVTKMTKRTIRAMVEKNCRF